MPMCQNHFSGLIRFHTVNVDLTKNCAASSCRIVSTSSNINPPISHCRNCKLHCVSCLISGDHAAVPQFGPEVACGKSMQDRGTCSQTATVFRAVAGRIDGPNDSI